MNRGTQLPPLKGIFDHVNQRLVDRTDPANMRDFVRKCPKLNAAISKRHYLLPKVRQADYVSQDFCDNHCRDLLLQWAMGQTEGKASLALETLNLIASIKYDRPTLYLERELGEKLVETEVPGDFSTNEINWPWPAFRVMLPTGLIRSTDTDGRPISPLYIDLHLWKVEQTLDLPTAHVSELNQFFGGDGKVKESGGVRHDATAFYLSALTDYQLPGYQPDACTCLGSWDDWKLRDMIASTISTMEGSNPQEVNHQLLAQLRAMMFNLLLFFSQEPVSVFTDNWVRKPRTEGKHQLSGLLPARFVGDCMPKLRVNSPVVVKADSEPTGRTHAPHWVRGFWKRVVYGKGRQLRKRQWIMPYKTGGEDGP